MSIYYGRDLIVMDNRGVGGSRPRLNCPEVEDVEMFLLEHPMPPEAFARERAEAYKNCKTRLTANHIDINAYNNASAAQDIEDLRNALGLGKLNLYGVSYGTRIALTYLRKFPENVHAIVLDGMEPPEVKVYEAAPQEEFIALKRIFDLCNRNQPCRLRYGEDFYERFAEFLAQLENKPIAIRVIDPENLQPLDIWLTPNVVVNFILSAIYDENNIGIMPKTVNILMYGSIQHVTDLINNIYLEQENLDYFDEGAYASYRCHDEAPFNDFAVALKEASTYPLQKYMNVSWILSE